MTQANSILPAAQLQKTPNEIFTPTTSAPVPVDQFSRCVGAAQLRASSEVNSLEKQHRKQRWGMFATDTALGAGVVGAAICAALGLLGPWLLPCAVVVLVLGFAFSSAQHGYSRKAELTLAHKRGEMAMANDMAQHVPPTRVADALAAPGGAALVPAL